MMNIYPPTCGICHGCAGTWIVTYVWLYESGIGCLISVWRANRRLLVPAVAAAAQRSGCGCAVVGARGDCARVPVCAPRAPGRAVCDGQRRGPGSEQNEIGIL